MLTVSSKAVAKVEGRVTPGIRDDLVAAETDRVVARRGPLRIVRTRHGLVLAAAGVDASNTAPGDGRAAAGRPGRLGSAVAYARSPNGPG